MWAEGSSAEKVMAVSPQQQLTSVRRRVRQLSQRASGQGLASFTPHTFLWIQTRAPVSFQGTGLHGSSEQGGGELEKFGGDNIHEGLVTCTRRKNLTPPSPAKFSSQGQDHWKAATGILLCIESLQCDEVYTSPLRNLGSLWQNQGSQPQFTSGLSPYLPATPTEQLFSKLGRYRGESRTSQVLPLISAYDSWVLRQFSLPIRPYFHIFFKKQTL